MADEERRRLFSRRELLRAGMAAPVLLTIPAAVAACGTNPSGSTTNVSHGDHTDTGHHDTAHVDAVHTDTGHTDVSPHADSAHADTGTTSQHGDTGHGSTTSTTSKGSSTTSTTSGHVDVAHQDSVHGDIVERTSHVDSGPHTDYVSGLGTGHHVHGDDGSVHHDGTQTFPHTDLPHLDAPHGDQS